MLWVRNIRITRVPKGLMQTQYAVGEYGVLMMRVDVKVVLEIDFKFLFE